MAIMDLVNSFMDSVRLDVDDDSKSKKGTKSNSGSQKPIKVVRKNGDSDNLDILSDETRDALLEYVNHRDSGIDLENLILKGEFPEARQLPHVCICKQPGPDQSVPGCS